MLERPKNSEAEREDAGKAEPVRGRRLGQAKGTGAARMRALRARRQAGGFIAQICIDPPIVELLIEAQFLPAWDAGDRTAVERALQAALHVWSRYETP